MNTGDSFAILGFLTWLLLAMLLPSVIRYLDAMTNRANTEENSLKQTLLENRLSRKHGSSYCDEATLPYYEPDKGSY